MPLEGAVGTCHARCHWNSPSYRAAAGNVQVGQNCANVIGANGAEGSRTPDLCSAIAALSQLSYSPVSEPVFRRIVRPNTETAPRAGPP